MKYAMSSNIDKIKNLHNKFINEFGSWSLLSEIFLYSCKTMNIELFNAIYEINNTIDTSIRLANNPVIFHKNILFQDITFFNKLLSHQGCLSVFNKNKQNLIEFTIQNRSRFMPILEMLTDYEINNYITMIIEDAIIYYSEDKIRVEDNYYINGDYIFITYITNNIVDYIPIKLIDEQYIKFLKTLIY